MGKPSSLFFIIIWRHVEIYNPFVLQTLQTQPSNDFIVQCPNPGTQAVTRRQRLPPGVVYGDVSVESPMPNYTIIGEFCNFINKNHLIWRIFELIKVFLQMCERKNDMIWVHKRYLHHHLNICLKGKTVIMIILMFIQLEWDLSDSQFVFRNAMETTEA